MRPAFLLGHEAAAAARSTQTSRLNSSPLQEQRFGVRGRADGDLQAQETQTPRGLNPRLRPGSQVEGLAVAPRSSGCLRMDRSGNFESAQGT